MFDYQFAEKGLKFIINCQLSKMQMHMHTDQIRLKQVFINFISNALKYTFSGQISIDIEQDLPHNNIIKISVTDTGIGIPFEIQERLFKEYNSFDHSKGTNKYGVGLGLCIVRKLVGLLGPSENIQLKSQPGLGTTFTFYIYQDLDKKDQEFSSDIYSNMQVNLVQSSVSIEGESFEQVVDQLCSNQMRVLIVDDVTFNIQSLRMLLTRSSKLIVDAAYNG